MAASFARVTRRLWVDPRLVALGPTKPCAAMLFMRLLTAPEATALPGLLVLGPAAIAEALAWPAPVVRRLLAQLESSGLARLDLDHRVVWLPDALLGDPPQSPNVLRAWGKSLTDVPPCGLRDEVEAAIRDVIAQGKGEGFAQAFDDAMGRARPKPSPNPVPVPVPVPVPSEVHGRAHARSAESQGGRTPAPDGIPITEDLRTWAATAGAPEPTEEHVAACLAHARANGLLFADWTERLKSWLLHERQIRARGSGARLARPNGIRQQSDFTAGRDWDDLVAEGGADR